MTNDLASCHLDAWSPSGHSCSMVTSQAELQAAAGWFLRRELGLGRPTMAMLSREVLDPLLVELQNEGFPIELVIQRSIPSSQRFPASLASSSCSALLSWMDNQQLCSEGWALLVEASWAFDETSSPAELTHLVSQFGKRCTGQGGCLFLYDRTRFQAATLLAVLPLYSEIVLGAEAHCNPYQSSNLQESLLSDCLKVCSSQNGAACKPPPQQAHDSLRQAEASFRVLIERSPDAILVHREGRIIFINPAGLTLLKHRSSDSLLGQSLIGLIHPDDRPAVERRLANLDIDVTEIVEERFLRRDGSSVVLEVATVPIVFQGLRAYASIARDSTERRRMANRLAQADRMASVGTLAAGVAHEINNPLTYVMWNLQSIRDGLNKIADAIDSWQLGLRESFSEEQTSTLLGPSFSSWGPSKLRWLAERASEAADGSRRIRDIVRALKTFSRVDEERLAPVDVNDAVEAAINLAYNEIKYRAKLVKDLSELPPVLADDGRLAQVFVNLLINAAHAIQEGSSETNEIRISTYLSGSEVVVEVSDTGTGISPEHTARIFDPFFTTKPQGMGSGLGLFICHNIIHSYSGRIEVQTRLNEGSRFSVFLPCAELQPLTHPSQSKSEPPAGGGPARVLIVDDEIMVGTVLQRMLEHEHAIVVAHSGAEAQSLLQSSAQFDLILSDLLMPGMSGMELYDWVRTNLPDMEPWMLFMTGGAFTQSAREFLGKLGRPFLEKPFDPKEVRSLIRSVIKKRRGVVKPLTAL